MAKLRNSIPNEVSKDRRVKIEYDPSTRVWLQFGLTLPFPHPFEKQHYFVWIRENCRGYVYWVEYEMKSRWHSDAYVIEFFFKTVTDAVMFKMTFG